MFEEFQLSGLQVFRRAVPVELVEAAGLEAQAFPLERAGDYFFERPIEQAELGPHALRLQSYARSIAEQLIGTTNPPLRQNQFTKLLRGSPGGVHAHIDGSRLIKDFGNSWEFMPTFQVIIGVPLVDISLRGRGAVWFEPGGHHRTTEIIRNSWDVLMGMQTQDAFQYVMRLLNDGIKERKLALAGIGDAFAFHATLPHGSSENLGPDRPIWYFRFGSYAKTGREAYRETFPAESWPALSPSTNQGQASC